MRRLILKMQISVDGFVATDSGAMDWIFPSLGHDATEWIVDTLWRAGVHAMGRVTYHDMDAYWPSFVYASTASWTTPRTGSSTASTTRCSGI